MTRFLADESVDFRIVTLLRNAGYTVEAVLETNPGIDDESVLSLALAREAVLITEDKDFGELIHRLRRPYRGIVLLRLIGIDFEDKERILIRVFEALSAKFSGHFVVVKPDHVRFRKG
jgi:predicted nuclease of predicted toxin-antitoxin system